LHVVFDAFAVKPGSAAITLENLLKGWSELDTDDRITVLCVDEPPFVLPPGAGFEAVSPPRLGKAGTVWLRSVGVRRAARRLGADGLVSGVTASAFLGTSCPRGVILYDLRHELRPHQFPASRRLARRLSYAWTFRTTGGIYCISRRTRDDLLRTRPGLEKKAVLARYGADHVDAWPAAASTGAGSTGDGDDRPYALAFGHFANKNVNAVLDGWAVHCRETAAGEGEQEMKLRLVGMGRADREEATRRVADLGIADRVELMPWLDDAAFVRCFAGASLVIFPSDFEGFGLPAVEALRLRIPLVVSDDVALAEVTGGHAPVVPDVEPETIAKAIRTALGQTAEELAAGHDYTDQFTWRSMAAAIRQDLVGG
jgi:glycosyltransferase involved in cell wall biosynthesis